MGVCLLVIQGGGKDLVSLQNCLSFSCPSVRLNRDPAPAGESSAELSVRAQLLLSLMLLGHSSRKPLIRTLFFFFFFFVCLHE